MFKHTLASRFSVVALASTMLLGGTVRTQPSTMTMIVQGPTAEMAAAAVTQAGGTVDERLGLIDGVVVRTDAGLLARLQANPVLRLHENVQVTNAGKKKPGLSSDEQLSAGDYLYPSTAVGADSLHTQKIQTKDVSCANNQVTTSETSQERPLQGWGVTVAVIDSGFMKFQNASSWSFDNNTDTLFASNNGRCFVYKDFVARSAANDNTNKNNSTDPNGHGTHVVSTIADNRQAALGPEKSSGPVGVAPQVNLMIARALDSNGSGTYADVIRAIEWLIANKTRYNVQVLNMSLQSPVNEPYWYDPMNQAVMKAWQAGITVVVAAGNNGPEAGTISAPGNVPYVITVGALRNGRYTSTGTDELASFSARGPTESAFVKPDVVVAGTRTIAPVPSDSVLAQWMEQQIASGVAPAEARFAEADVDYGIGKPLKKHTYYQVSGTSMAAAEVSGLVALLLQAHPTLSNNDVKCTLLSNARASMDAETSKPKYTLWEQGAGMVDIASAVSTPATGCANVDMDIAQDLDTTSDPQNHYWGNTVWDPATGRFALIDPTTGATIDQWDGGNPVSTSRRLIWVGGKLIWVGNTDVWAGRKLIWVGGIQTWDSSKSAWASRRLIWVGSDRTWSSASTAGHVLSTGNVPILDQPIKPVLECVSANADGSYTAHFGYSNANIGNVDVAVGAGNLLTPAPASPPQPTTFLPGMRSGVFSVVFDGTPLVWRVNGYAATATSSSAACN